jgi:F-type H+-transporting ATPase subunit delta
MTRHTDALSGVYARSLYELAEEAGGREKIIEIADEIEQVCELARGDHMFREFMGSPIVDRGRRADALRDIFRERVTDLLLRFLLVLNDRGRLGHLDSIGNAFDQLVHEAFGRVEVDVFTPGSLDAAQVETLKQRIGKALGKEPVVYAYTDPDMIGGLKLRIGDQLIDGSVAARLRRIRHNFLTQGSAAIRERFDRILGEGDGQ